MHNWGPFHPYIIGFWDPPCWIQVSLPKKFVGLMATRNIPFPQVYRFYRGKKSFSFGHIWILKDCFLGLPCWIPKRSTLRKSVSSEHGKYLGFDQTKSQTNHLKTVAFFEKWVGRPFFLGEVTWRIIPLSR